MKIRCVTNSIRYRLRKSDFRKLQAEGCVAETITFPNGATFVYGLQLVHNKQLTATFSNSRMLIHLPKVQAEDWIHSETVGIEQEIRLPSGHSLYILLEKDFPCGHTDADREDTFYELVEEKEVC